LFGDWKVPVPRPKTTRQRITGRIPPPSGLAANAREKEQRHEDDDVLGHEVQDDGEAPEAERGAPEEPKVEERLRRPALDRDERGAEEDGGGEKRGGDGVDAALLKAVHREQKRRERAEDGERAQHVDPSRPAPEVRQDAPRERGTGSDVMKRIAAPMIGGLFTSFLLELLVYPPVYQIWKWNFEMKREGGLDRNPVSPEPDLVPGD
jgi:hypothetical protein